MKVNELTAAQKRKLSKIRDKWIGIGLSTGPGNIEKAWAGIQKAYETAGRKKPSYLVWLESPYKAAIGCALLRPAFELAIASLKSAPRFATQVRDQVRDQVSDQVRAQVLDQVSDQVRAQVSDQVRDQVSDQVRAQVLDQVSDQVRAQVSDQVSAQVRAQVLDQVSAQVSAQVSDQVLDQVSAQVSDQVSDQVRDQVSDQVRAQVLDQVSAQVSDQVLDQVSAQVSDQVSDQVRDQVSDQVSDQVRAQVSAQVSDQVSAQVLDQVSDQVSAQVLDQVSAQVSAQVLDQVSDQVSAQVSDQVSDQVSAQVSDQVSAQVRAQVSDQVSAQVRDFASYRYWWLPGQFQGFWLSYYEALSDFCSFEKLEGLVTVANNCAFAWTFPDVVVFCQPPVEIHRNAAGQLHCETGPAITFADGWGVWALNGVRVTQEIVETPANQLDPKLILTTQNAEWRREIVRKIGIERVCLALNAECVDKEGDYELLMLSLGDRRRRPYLKMRNPSIGVFHIEGVSPQCRTVQQALNFRNGLTPSMIDDKNGADWIQQGDVILRPRGAQKFKSRPIVLT